jgi:hypothetical protein
MVVLVFVFFLCAVFFTVLSYLSPEAFYRFYSRLRETDSPLLRILGFGRQEFQDPEAWIRNFRVYLMLLAAVLLVLVALVSMPSG